MNALAHSQCYPEEIFLMNPDELLELARQLVDQGAERGVTLRILGSLAVRSHIQDGGAMLDLLGRVPTHDIDFLGYSKEQAQIDRMFKDLDYEIDPAVAFSLEYGLQRLIYHQREGQIMAEVFLDKLSMAHTLDFRGRLELDSPTISLVDLLLTKLQVQQITEKDIKDVIALLAEHELGTDGQEVVDVRHLLKLTSEDWGLYYTARNNLAIVEQWVGRIDVLDVRTRQDVAEKTHVLEERMEEEPKSLRWRLRAIIGTRVRWYEHVGDVYQ
jgi:hypothetical protein